MYTAKDLKWAKSVTRDKGTDWAYTNYKAGDFFNLNCSTVNRNNILKPKKGDLILLFQSYKKVTYITHLLSPAEDITEIDDNSIGFPITRKMFVVDSLKLEKPNTLDFKGPNRGKICPIDTIKDFKTKEKINLNELQSNLIELFDKTFFESKEILNECFNYSLDIDEAEEGKKNERLRWHKYYERNPEIIIKAKNKAKKDNKLFCEVCGFDFEKHYPELGNGFIECHHIVPIAKGGIRKTRIEDLAIVCSNCHRMLHRKEKDGDYPSIERLKKIMLPVLS